MGPEEKEEESSGFLLTSKMGPTDCFKLSSSNQQAPPPMALA